MWRQILHSCDVNLLCRPYLYNRTIYSFIPSKALFHQEGNPLRDRCANLSSIALKPWKAVDIPLVVQCTCEYYEIRVVTVILRSESNKVTVKVIYKILLCPSIETTKGNSCKVIRNILRTKRTKYQIHGRSQQSVRKSDYGQNKIFSFRKVERLTKRL